MNNVAPFGSEVWYRYIDGRYAPQLNEFDEPVGTGSAFITCHEYPVIKHTPKGARLSVIGGARWVSKETRKRFACATKEEAWESFKARKKAQIRILRAQVKNVEEVLRMINKKERDG